MPAQTGFVVDFTRRALIRGIAPLGALRAENLMRAGLPGEFRSAFEFLFTHKLTTQDRRVVARVEAMRDALARRTEPFEVILRDGSRASRSPQSIAQDASVTADWGTFLYFCAKGFRSRTILELGSCAGISGSYLASAPECREFVSIERSPALAAAARSHICRVLPQAEVITANFDNVLDGTLARLTCPLDLYYVDGNHWYEPTLRYFEKAIPFLEPGALVIFDDIHWSREMWEAWLVLRAQKGFAYTIDLGRFGLCLWQGDNVQPKSYNLARYVGWLWNYAPR